MRNWVGEGLADFLFTLGGWRSALLFTVNEIMWSPVLVVQANFNLKISDSTEGVDGSNISIYGFYLLKVPTLQRFWRLTQEVGRQFASGK